jgi:hypothetical protein
MKENFDDIIRRRWEAREFPVDARHREEMARLLNPERKRKGIVFWWFGGIAGLLLLSGVGWWALHHTAIAPTPAHSPIAVASPASDTPNPSSPAADISTPIAPADEKPDRRGASSRHEDASGAGMSETNSAGANLTTPSRLKQEKETQYNSKDIRSHAKSADVHATSGDLHGTGSDELIPSAENETYSTQTETGQPGYYKVELDHPDEAKIATLPFILQPFHPRRSAR